MRRSQRKKRMNKYKLSNAGISVAEGIKRLNGNKELYEKLLHEFPSDERYKKLCIAIEKKDVKEAFMQSHALKGLAGNLSMNEFYKSIVPLVELLRRGSLEDAEMLLSNVTSEYEKIILALQEV